MALILLIRHGENDFVGKRLMGRLPGVHLNERGHQQAAALVELLAGAPLRALYSSPLERTLETAAPLAVARGLRVSVSEALNELDYGAWQGKTLKQLRRMRLWKVVQDQPDAMRFPGGESFVEAQTRLCTFLDSLAAAQGDEPAVIACFTHGDMVRLAAAHYLDMPLNSFQRLSADTASLTALALGKGRPHLLCLNQVAALDWPKPPADGKK